MSIPTNEAQTRALQIDPRLRAAGWKLKARTQVRLEVPVDSYDTEPLISSEVFLGNIADAHGLEALSWCESSDGSQLPDVSVFVQARQAWTGVQAMISPQ